MSSALASRSGTARSAPAGLWQRIVAWFRKLFSRRRARLPSAELPSRPIEEAVPGDLRDQVEALRGDGVVWDTVRRAIEDFDHLREVMMGPGATADAIDDIEMLAEAEDRLRAVIARAPGVQVLIDVAGDRKSDREAREATGAAILELRDQARVLHDAASAAIRWASTRSEPDRQRLSECAARLSVG